MNILFIHPDFPTHFLRLAAELGADRKNTVVLVSRERQTDWQAAGVRKVLYKDPPAEAVAKGRTREYERAILTGEAVAEILHTLKTKERFLPDIICGYSGGGATGFVKEVFPAVPFLAYFDWYYRSRGSNLDFDPAFPLNFGTTVNAHIRNASILNDLTACDHGITPTLWQKQQLPVEFHHKITQLHDGIDTDFFAPAEEKKLILPDLDLSGVVKLVTYSAAGMEPYRGFPQFIEALPVILRQDKECHVVISGADRSFYSPQRTDGKTYKEFMLEQVELDMDRVHFVGSLPREQHCAMLQASTVHVYLTYPFILSRSLLEALSCGCTIVASNTPPVLEVISDGENGVLVDFFSAADIANKVIASLSFPSYTKMMREKARRTIEDNFSLSRQLPRQMKLVQRIAAPVFQATLFE